jgi:putative membrane protein
VDNGNRTWLVVLAVVLLVVLLGPGLGMGMMGWGAMGPGMMMGGWGAAANPWWGMAMLAFWALIMGGVVLLVVWGIRQVGPVGDARRGPLDILKERYARGELTREQYEQMRRDLE